jgi:hypothetical protein
MGPQPTGAGAFQPASGFPQQYPIPPGYPYSGTGYPAPHTQTTNATPSYLAEFDPYAQQQQAPSPSQFNHSNHGATSSGTGPAGVTHPRDVIRTHKSGLEAWDTYSWKQLFSACDALKQAWSARKQQAEGIVLQYGGHSDPGLFGPDPAFGYNSQVEGWKQVRALSLDPRVVCVHVHIGITGAQGCERSFRCVVRCRVCARSDGSLDTVAASTFQLHEVFNSYRQSGDQASKQRVRESCNAAVKGLPDWPSN